MCLDTTTSSAKQQYIVPRQDMNIQEMLINILDSEEPLHIMDILPQNGQTVELADDISKFIAGDAKSVTFTIKHRQNYVRLFNKKITISEIHVVCSGTFKTD